MVFVCQTGGLSPLALRIKIEVIIINTPEKVLLVTRIIEAFD
jgi:hypothetical protein